MASGARPSRWLLAALVIAALGFVGVGAQPASAHPSAPVTAAKAAPSTQPDELACTSLVTGLGSFACTLVLAGCNTSLGATQVVLPPAKPWASDLLSFICTAQHVGDETPQNPPATHQPGKPGKSTGQQPSRPGQHAPATGQPHSTPANPAASAPIRISDVQVVAGAGSLLATWSAAQAPPGTTYTATAQPGGASCTSTGEQCLITGLENGTTYRIAVLASHDGSTGESVAGSHTPRADATHLTLALGISTGATVGGSTSTVTGEGLLPGSRVKVIVHSTPRTLGSFPVAADGTFHATVHLPAGLEAGAHQLTASGKGIDGSTVSGKTGFEVTASGTLAAPAGTQEPGDTAASDTRSAATGRAAFAPYDPRDHADDTITTMGTAFALAMAAGGIGALQRRRVMKPAKPKTRSGKKPSVSMSHQEFRAEAIEPGDRSRTWVSPFYKWFDRIGLHLPQRLNIASPMVARLVNDAAYLRAMIGSASIAPPLAGLVLGALAAYNTGGEALPPSNGLLFAIVLLAIFDALAGFAAAVTFSLGVLFSGGIADAASLRTILALDVVFFAVILVVSATRELRRHPAENTAEWYDRAADFVIGTLLAMLTIKSVVSALPALAGLDLPVTDSINELVWLVGAATLLRFAAETLAAHWYPERLLLVAPQKINPPPNWRTWVAIFVKLAAFMFFAVSYMGTDWPMWVSSALMFVSLTMSKWKARFPDWPFLAKIIPGGIIGILFYFLLGIWASEALKAAVSDPAKVSELGFFLLMIPGLICAAIALTARNGDGWKLTWLWRITGIPMLVVTVLLVGGFVAVV